MEQEIHTPFELFGYDCGEGWWPLIKEAQQLIDKWNELNYDGDHGKVEFAQVKEKWGELCLYLNWYPEELIDPIRKLEERSRHVCEHCGTTENVTLENTHGWYMTLCHECRKKELEIYTNMFKH